MSYPIRGSGQGPTPRLRYSVDDLSPKETFRVPTPLRRTTATLTAALAAAALAAVPVNAGATKSAPTRRDCRPRPPAPPTASSRRCRSASGSDSCSWSARPATSVSAATRSQIGRYHVGNVMLTGRSYGGTRTPARVAAAMQARATTSATAGVRLLVATDQEGGRSRCCTGSGLSEIPTALTQGTLDAPAPAAAGRHLGTAAARRRRQHEPRPGHRHGPVPAAAARTTRRSGSTSASSATAARVRQPQHRVRARHGRPMA